MSPRASRPGPRRASRVPWPLRAFVAASVWLLLGSWPRVALAGRVLIDLAFDAEAGDRPTDLCIVTPFGDESSKYKPLEADQYCKPRANVPGLRVAKEETCGGPGYCEPRCELPASYDARRRDPRRAAKGTRQYYVVCEHNAFEPDENRARPLYVLLDLQKDETLRYAVSGGGPTTALKFSGDTATVTIRSRLEDNQFEKERFQAKVIGGSYLPREMVYSRDRLISLELLPRCGQRTALVPPGYWNEERTKVILPGGEPVTLLSTDPGRAIRDRRVRLTNVPYCKDGLPKRLEVLVSPPASEPDAGARVQARYVAHWTEARPPPMIEVHPVQLSFLWKRHELYSSKGCPRVKLEQTGGSCAEVASSEKACLYTCPGTESPSDIVLDMPMKLLFHDAVFDDEWQASVSHDAQTVDAYVPPAERRVVLAYDETGSNSAWNLVRFGIEWIEVTTSGGTVRLAPREWSGPGSEAGRVLVPGLQEGTVLSYTYIGRRAYRQRFEKVQNGQLRLSPPEVLEKNMYLGLAASAGTYSRMAEGDRSKAAENGSVGGVAYPSLGFFFGYRNTIARLELRASVMVNGQSYFALAGADTSPPPRRDVAYLRSVVEAGFWTENPVQIGFPYATGLTLGVISGRPIEPNDERLVGGPQAAFTLSAGVLFFPYSPVSVELRGRFCFGEHLVRFTLNERGTPDRELLDNTWGGAELTIRTETFFSFFSN